MRGLSAGLFLSAPPRLRVNQTLSALSAPLRESFYTPVSKIFA